MLRPKKDSYKEFDNPNLKFCGSKIPLSPINAQVREETETEH